MTSQAMRKVRALSAITWTLRDSSSTFSIAPSSREGVAPLVRRRVAEAVHGDRGTDHSDDDEEERAQAVDAKRDPGQRKEGSGEGRRESGAETDGAQHQPGQGAHERAPGDEPAPGHSTDTKRGERPDRVGGEHHPEQEMLEGHLTSPARGASPGAPAAR